MSPVIVKPPPPAATTPKPPAAAAPVLTLTVARQRLAAVLKRGLSVRLACTTSCRASLILVRGKQVLARRAGVAGRTTLKLSAAARRSLARARRVTLTLTASAPGARGVSRRVVLTATGAGTGASTTKSPSASSGRPSVSAAAASTAKPRSCGHAQPDRLRVGGEVREHEQRLAGLLAAEAEDVVVAGPDRLDDALDVDRAGRAAGGDQALEPGPQPALDRRGVVAALGRLPVHRRPVHPAVVVAPCAGRRGRSRR